MNLLHFRAGVSSGKGSIRARVSVKAGVSLLCISLCLTVLCCNSGSGKEPPQVYGGVLDLSGWDLDRDGPVDLSGEWEFYWEKLYDTGDFSAPGPPEMTGYFNVPGTWNGYMVSGRPLPGTGYATFRMIIVTNDPVEIEAFWFRTISTAFSFFVNGKPVFSAGKPGKSVEESLPAYYTHVAPVEIHAGINELVLHVSNFHYRSGGPWGKITFGLERHLRRNKGQRNYIILFLFGALSIISFYYLGFWIMRREEKSFLYFSLFCIFISLRTLVTGEYIMVHLFPDIPFRLLVILEYMTFYVSLPLFCLFVDSLYKDIFSKRILRAVLVTSALFILFVLITPVKIFTWSVIPFQALTIVVCIYLFYILLISVRRRIEGSRLMLAGGTIVFAAIINDILFSHSVIGTANLVHGAVFMFILLQSFILSRRLSNSFRTAERLSVELNDLNLNLENKVRARTRELEQANREIRNLSIMDTLTGCNNRLFMNENLPRDIGRSLRYRKHLSIILCDIDNFKKVNDTHGHQAGDLVLADFARYLKKSIRFNTDWIVRYGGEEFMIVLPETSIDNAAFIAERMRTDIEGMRVLWHEREISTTASFGVTGIDPETPVDAVSMESLIGKADKLLYDAKKMGKNVVRAEKLVPAL